MIKEVALSVFTGAAAGIVFAFFKLPVPAPPVFAGVAGIVGLWAGYSLVSRFLV
jgi:XapX domain-containing protein